MDTTHVDACTGLYCIHVSSVSPSLPPALHQVKQTIYHVYAVDVSTNKEWELWKPKAKNEKSLEIDTSVMELVVNEQSFPSLNGYCWVDMHALIQECDKLVRQYMF